MKTALDILKSLNEAFNAYETFVDMVSQEDEEVFLKANKGTFPSGKTVLSATYCPYGTPRDMISTLKGYLLAIDDLRKPE